MGPSCARKYAREVNKVRYFCRKKQQKTVKTKKTYMIIVGLLGYKHSYLSDGSAVKILLIFIPYQSQSKVANFANPVCSQQNVSCREITMKDLKIRREKRKTIALSGKA